MKLEWIDGVARGEIPWFGLLKLWISGPTPTSVPENSKTDLFIAIGLIIGVPILIDVAGFVLERKGIDFWGGVRRRLYLKGKDKDAAKPETKEEVKAKDGPPPEQPKPKEEPKTEKKAQPQQSKNSKKGRQKGKSKKKSKR